MAGLDPATHGVAPAGEPRKSRAQPQSSRALLHAPGTRPPQCPPCVMAGLDPATHGDPPAKAPTGEPRMSRAQSQLSRSLRHAPGTRPATMPALRHSRARPGHPRRPARQSASRRTAHVAPAISAFESSTPRSWDQTRHNSRSVSWPGSTRPPTASRRQSAGRRATHVARATSAFQLGVPIQIVAPALMQVVRRERPAVLLQHPGGRLLEARSHGCMWHSRGKLVDPLRQIARRRTRSRRSPMSCARRDCGGSRDRTSAPASETARYNIGRLKASRRNTLNRVKAGLPRRRDVIFQRNDARQPHRHARRAHRRPHTR